jgi:hypothetical protein
MTTSRKKNRKSTRRHFKRNKRGGDGILSGLGDKFKNATSSLSNLTTAVTGSKTAALNNMLNSGAYTVGPSEIDVVFKDINEPSEIDKLYLNIQWKDSITKDLPPDSVMAKYHINKEGLVKLKEYARISTNKAKDTAILDRLIREYDMNHTKNKNLSQQKQVSIFDDRIINELNQNTTPENHRILFNDILKNGSKEDLINFISNTQNIIASGNTLVKLDDYKTPDLDGNTPIMNSASNPSEEIFMYLITEPTIYGKLSFLNNKNNNETLLHIASNNNNINIIKKIFEIMDVNRIDNGGVISYKTMSDFLNKMINVSNNEQYKPIDLFVDKEIYYTFDNKKIDDDIVPVVELFIKNNSNLVKTKQIIQDKINALQNEIKTDTTLVGEEITERENKINILNKLLKPITEQENKIKSNISKETLDNSEALNYALGEVNNNRRVQTTLINLWKDGNFASPNQGYTVLPRNNVSQAELDAFQTAYNQKMEELFNNAQNKVFEGYGVGGYRKKRSTKRVRKYKKNRKHTKRRV